MSPLLAAASEAALQAAEPDRELLTRILEEPELSGASQAGSAIASIIEALQTLLGTLLGSEGAVGAAEVTRLIFFVLTAIVVVWLIRKLLQRLSPPPARAQLDPLSPLRLESPEHHEALAEAAVAAGRPREALRHLLLSALAALERSRWASYGRHKTNREYLRSIERRGAPAALCEAFGELVRTYDPLWYGQEEVGPPQLEAIGRLAAAARDAAARSPREGAASPAPALSSAGEAG
ncbi:MAG: DUF4129 domain-containing protein [Deltaproteobacteria bacterium]|nr:DUF4129 domain-containing protein [Deltaproteobacteria bacterium]